MTTGAVLPFVKMHGLGNDFVIFDGRAKGFVTFGKVSASRGKPQARSRMRSGYRVATGIGHRSRSPYGYL
jgi:hypothetical protein